jgi:hypothetical protein
MKGTSFVMENTKQYEKIASQVERLRNLLKNEFGLHVSDVETDLEAVECRLRERQKEEERHE